MVLLVSTVIGLVLFMICIGADIGGTMGALLFLSALLVGGIMRAWAPLIEWMRGPAARL